MVRNTAREIAIHLSYELSFTDRPIDELLDHRLTAETFATLAEEDAVYAESPNAKQAEYIRRLVKGVEEHAAELDSYNCQICQGLELFPGFAWWPPPSCGLAMYEILYMRISPTAPLSMRRWRSPKITRHRRR